LEVIRLDAEDVDRDGVSKDAGELVSEATAKAASDALEAIDSVSQIESVADAVVNV
jgi:hypothetical protein